MIDENLKRTFVLALTMLPILASVHTGQTVYLWGLVASVINSAFVYSKVDKEL